MSYKTVLAHVCVGQDNSNVNDVGAALAEMFGAQLIGVSGLRLSPPIAAYSGVPGAEIIQYEQEADELSLKEIEQKFRASFGGRNISVSWRASCNFTPVSEFVAQEARAADLIVTSPDPETFLERVGESHLGPLVLEAGRPVLVVPRQQHDLKLNKVVVAWKDTREARRAVADALPLLRKSRQVLILEICRADQAEEAKRAAMDVADWLGRHGIVTSSHVEVSGDSELAALHRILNQENCDLVVGGAYGHTRLREWVFGGVTKDLLLAGERCALLSH